MGWYFVITEEMRALDLKGNELIVFAILQGYSQKGDGCYYGGQTLLAERAGITRKTLFCILSELKKKGLVEEFPITKNGHVFTAYTATPCVKITHQGEEITHGDGKKLPMAMCKNYPQKENIKENINNNATLSRALVRDNPPTEKEVAEYARQRGFADPAGFAAYYIAVQTEAGWMSGKGKNRKPIDNWKLNVLAWEPNHKFDTYNSPTPKAPSPRPSTAGAVNNPNQFWK